MTTTQSGIELGVTLYSYGADYLITMTLEDCLADVADMGATGIEILSETHIPGYPNPTDEWVDQWHTLTERYGLTPTCYDCWIDTRLHKDRDMTLEEASTQLRRDMELANRLGFTIMRPKLGVVSGDLIPDPVWRETVLRALPDAEKLNVRIAPEIHAPTPLKSRIVDDYLALAKETGSKYFGLLIDTGVFQDRRREEEPGNTRQTFGARVLSPEALAEIRRVMGTPLAVDPTELIDIMPYVLHVHGKFWDMTSDLTDPHIPWDKIVKVLVEGGYKGFISSEYEGRRDPFRASEVLRRQHLMLRKLLAEYGVSVPGR